MVVFWYPKDFNSHEVHAEDMGDSLTLLHVTDIEGGKHVFKVTTEVTKNGRADVCYKEHFPSFLRKKEN